MKLFSHESTRLEFAVFAYDYAYDKDNYYKVYKAFEFEMSIDELKEKAEDAVDDFKQSDLGKQAEEKFDDLKEKALGILDKHNLKYDIEWTYNGLPFLTKPGELVDAMVDAIQTTVNITPELSTSGGTSDGRFIAKMGTQVVELGPINATIHQVNEHVDAESLNQLSSIYTRILKNLFANNQ